MADGKGKVCARVHFSIKFIPDALILEKVKVVRSAGSTLGLLPGGDCLLATLSASRLRRTLSLEETQGPAHSHVGQRWDPGLSDAVPCATAHIPCSPRELVKLKRRLQTL